MQILFECLLLYRFSFFWRIKLLECFILRSNFVSLVKVIGDIFLMIYRQHCALAIESHGFSFWIFVIHVSHIHSHDYILDLFWWYIVLSILDLSTLCSAGRLRVSLNFRRSVLVQSIHKLFLISILTCFLSKLRLEFVDYLLVLHLFLHELFSLFLNITHLLFHWILLLLNFFSKLFHHIVDLVFHLVLNFVHHFCLTEFCWWRGLLVWMLSVRKNWLSELSSTRF